MAKSKTDLLAEAQALGLEVTTKNTIAEIKEAIDGNTQESGQSSDTSQDQAKEVVATAKAGKRSAKGLKEAEEKQAKVEGQQHRDEAHEAAEKPKQHSNPTRSRLERRGKGFRKSAELIEKDKAYSLSDAMELAVKTSHVKFDATVELHINLGVDPRHADQNIRDNLVLPEGTGKSVRVAVFADENTDNADIAGVETITKALDKGTIDFDILIATPANMAKLGKFARLLGPRGLMPNPKSGTVTTDIQKAVAEAKAGRVEYRVDSTGIVHIGIGKVSFGADRLLKNASAVFASLRSNKPASVKGNFVKAVHATTSMGPSITVDLATIG
jgi:large subunit ribosomal protein L1